PLAVVGVLVSELSHRAGIAGLGRALEPAGSAFWIGLLESLAEVEHGFDAARVRSLHKPTVCLIRVGLLRDRAEDVHRVAASCLSRLFQPAACLVWVAQLLPKEDSEPDHRICAAILGGAPVPLG